MKIKQMIKGLCKNGVMLCTLALIIAAHPSQGISQEISQGIPSAELLNRDMGLGFNLGNVFDNGQNASDPVEIKSLIDLYLSAGMRHVRIPVTWGGSVRGSVLADRQGNINRKNPRLAQLKTVVDYALAKGLVVVLNTHHEHWLKDRYDASPVYDNAFSTLWKEIASEFKSRSPKLIFEILNEPEKAFGDWTGGIRPDSPRALFLTRRINEVGVQAIRSTGGTNLTRVVMVGTNGQGNHSMLDDLYPTAASLPGAGKDRYLIATVHTYDPWNFCGQTGLNANWPGDKAITNPIRAVAAHARKIGVPVNYGEFGVGRDQRAEERDTDLIRNYYILVVKTARAEGMSATLWDDRGWFGLTKLGLNGKFSFTNGIVPFVSKPK